MITPRELAIDRAILTALAAVPADMLLGDATLQADAARMVQPRPSVGEIIMRVRALDARLRIQGIAGETEMEWQITPQGRLWLSRNP